jgi:hypothetical protein
MLTEYEARKIRRDMEPELNARSASVIGCLGGLVIVVVLAVAAPEIRPVTNIDPMTAEGHEAPASERNASAAPAGAGDTIEVRATRAPIGQRVPNSVDEK